MASIGSRSLGLLLCTVLGCADPTGDGSGGVHQTPDPAADLAPPSDGAPPDPPKTPRPPPALSGGTLLATRDGHSAVAADPDRDTLWIVDLDTRALRRSIPLRDGDEPGRLTEDAAGRVHVVLRGGDAVLTLDPMTGAVQRRAACRGPRGIGHEPATDLLHVTCASNELVSLPAGGGDVVRRVPGPPGMRDVVVDRGNLYFTTFQGTRLYQVNASGQVGAIRTPPTFIPSVPYDGSPTGPPWYPAVAWRTLALPGGGVAMLHQRFLGDLVRDDKPPAFSRAALCSTTSGVVHTSLSFLVAPPDPFVPAAIGGAVLPIDFAVSPARSQVAIVAAGARAGDSQLLVSPWNAYVTSASCINGNQSNIQLRDGVIAVTYDPAGRVLAQTRQPPAVHVFSGSPLTDQPIPLPGAPRDDPGHRLFHEAPGVYVACASCHPEGGQDGITWQFQVAGRRRTQDLRGGGLQQTLPFHWDGSLADLRALLDRSFTVNLSGPALADEDVAALGRWLDALPAPPAPPGDAAAIARGQAVFVKGGCATCHSGPRFTNNQSVNVGTGGTFQVPSLTGLASRAPYLHHGCAPDLTSALFGACFSAPGTHVNSAALYGATLADLLAYLASL